MIKLDFKTRIMPVMDLESHYDDFSIMRIRGTGDSVICELYNNHSSKSSKFLDVPRYAYDAVARGDFSTVGEIKQYIRDHPQPNLP